MTDHDGAGLALLAPLRDDQLPASGVDIAGAARAGDRRRRHRRLVATGSTVLTVFVVLTTIGLTLGPRLGDPTPPVPPGGSVSVPPIPEAQFDPLHENVTVTPPDGFVVDTVITTQGIQTVILAGGVRGMVTSFVLAPDATTAPPVYLTGVSIPFPPATTDRLRDIGGLAAYRAPCPPERDHCAVISWQWAPGAWGLTMVERYPVGGQPAPSVDDLTQLALSAIGGIRPVRPATVVRSPHRVAAPAGTALSAVIRHDERRVDLIYAPPGHTGTPTVIVSVRRDLPVDPGAPDSIDGHPALIEDTEVTVYNVVGEWSLRVTAQPENLLGSREALVAFAKSVAIVPDPDDVTTWGSPG